MMKKILSLILVACMAFSCLALSACVWEGIWQTTTSTIPTISTTQPTTKPTTSTTTTTTTTTIPDDGGEPEDLVIRHGDNFTEEDIKFLEWLHGRSPFNISQDVNDFTLEDLITNITYGYPLLYISSDIDSGYVICPYIDIDALSSKEISQLEYTAIDITKYEWHKFSITENIPPQIENLEIYDAFSHVFFDSVANDCMVDDTSKNISYKYVFSCSSTNLENAIRHINEYQNIFYTGWNNPYNIDFNMLYLSSIRSYPRVQKQCYTDANGAKYLIDKGYLYGAEDNGNVIINNYAIEYFFGIYSDDLASELVYLPELSEEMTDGSTRCYFGLPLDDFLDYVNGLMK